MTAAAELIAELGWGRVTTRAVAERAGLPHGAVSYHSRGKQELLIEATMFTFARAVPADEFAALAGLEDFIGLVAADRDAIDPVLSRLFTGPPARGLWSFTGWLARPGPAAVPRSGSLPWC